MCTWHIGVRRKKKIDRFFQKVGILIKDLITYSMCNFLFLVEKRLKQKTGKDHRGII